MNTSTGFINSTNSFEGMNISNRRKRILIKPIIYPIFESIKESTDDVYWIEILEDSSRGRFPKTIIFENSYLYVIKRKRKILSKSFDAKTNDEIIKIFIDFVTKHTGMMSDRQAEQYSNYIPDDDDLKWTDINRKQSFLTLKLNRYINNIFNINHSNRFGEELTGQDKVDIFNKLFLCCKLKIINKNNIMLENSDIISLPDVLSCNEIFHSYSIKDEHMDKISQRAKIFKPIKFETSTYSPCKFNMKKFQVKTIKSRISRLSENGYIARRIPEPEI